MKRNTPMKRTGFKRPFPPPQRQATQSTCTPRPRLVAVASAASNASVFNPQPKIEVLDHQGYMKLVRGLPCARCGWFRKGGIQFCHADEGKGMGAKTDCRLGWPGCGPHDGLPGCHYLIGTARILPKEERREFERQAGANTRTAILDAGMWPARLPLWRKE